MDTQHEAPQRAPNKPRRPGDLSWLRIALQVIQAAAHVLDAPDHVGVHFFFDSQNEYEGLACGSSAGFGKTKGDTESGWSASITDHGGMPRCLV